MWTLQDIEDELTAGTDALVVGDLSTDEQQGFFCHARARRHFARARRMVSERIQHIADLSLAEANAATKDAAQSGGSGAGFTPETAPPASASEASTPPSDAFLAEPTDVATALAGPYREHTLVIPRGYVRWVLKDAGGARVSICATPDRSPSDAIAESDLKGLAVEGYYRYGMNAHLWEPVVTLSRGSLPA